MGLEEIGAAIGAEKVMTMTSTYDHRIIQGAESGRFLAAIESRLQGEHGFYEDVFRSLDVAAAATAGPPRCHGGFRVGAAGDDPAAAAAAAVAAAAQQAAVVSPPDEELLQAVQAATSLLKAHRTHGHLAAKLDPLGRAARGRSVARSGVRSG